MESIWPWLRHHWWVFVVLAISLAGSLKRGEQGHAEPTLLTGVLVIVAVLPLFWRERRPDLGVLVNAAAVAVYFAATYADGPIYLSVLLSTFALTSRRPPRAWLPYAGAALVTILAGLIVREIRVDVSSTIGSLGWATWFVTVDSAAAAVGLAVRNRRETRTEKIRRTATEEQLRMAQDLHDGVGHGLAVIAMQAGVALHVLDRDPDAARRSLEAIRDTSTESLDALRAELVRLSPAQGDGQSEPAPRAPRNGLADLEVLAARVRAGGVQVVLDVEPVAVDPQVDAVAYSVVQEALTNVLRHAEASTARVAVRLTSAGLEIDVADDGRGVPSSAGAAAGQGMGIPGMRSRVEALGGTLAAGPEPGRGFVVRAVLPSSGASAEEVRT
jgi:signal transduction histidine kinase